MSERQMRLGAVFASSVFLDGAGCVAKACDLIAEAGRRRITVLGFPEGFIPGHPVWYHFRPASEPASLAFAERLSDNAVVVPGPEVDALCEAARSARVFVVIGCCERLRRRPGTLFNSLLFIDGDGHLVGRHRKLMPTLGEQLVHTMGDAEGLDPFPVQNAGFVSGLMCGENSNPLAAFALDALGANVHVAAWPPFFQMGADMAGSIEVVTRGLAYQMKAFIINAVGAIDEELIAQMAVNDEQRTFLRNQHAGASIIDPWGKIMAGPMNEDEGILVADVDLGATVRPKLVHDYGGRYNRFDLFHVSVSRGNYDAISTAVDSGAAENVDINQRRRSDAASPRSADATRKAVPEPYAGRSAERSDAARVNSKSDAQDD